jgi:PRTRC genetic system ThiF family protein
MVGCGGTGSQLAQAVSRLVYTLNDVNRPTKLTFIDFDIVEKKNLGRQLFCPAELGLQKSVALATRYGHALGLDIEAYTKPFKEYELKTAPGRLIVLVGCVDNHMARRDLANTINNHAHRGGQLVWLDCGNLRDSGKVYLGTGNRPERLYNSFPMDKICIALPTAAMLQPKLLEPEDLTEVDQNLSCAEMVNLQLQSLQVNMMTATIAASYLTRLLVDNDLRIFATYFDLKSGSMRSEAIHPDVISKLTGIPAKKLTNIKRRKSHKV